MRAGIGNDGALSLFQRWLMYGIGTIFSMAVLAFVSSLVLQLSLRVSAAMWTAELINKLTGNSAEGLSTKAMQQGGLGMLLTVLIVSVPPMAAVFFQGTVGNFMAFSAFGGGAASQPGPQGQPPGSDGGGENRQQNARAGQSPLGELGGTSGFSNPNAGTRLTGNSTPAPNDVIKRSDT